MQKKVCMFLILMLFATAALARSTDYYGQLWNGFFVRGRIGQSSNWIYSSGLEFRFLNPNGNIYQRSFLFGSLGYAVNPVLSLWLGYSIFPVLDARTNKTFVENRPWQQIKLALINQDSFIMILRSRIEERLLTDRASWAYRLRQRFIYLFPKLIAHKIGVGGYEELFFNLNRPSWLSAEDTFAQNRFFIGMQLPVEKHVSLWVGYLNVYHFRSPVNRMVHVFYLSLNINMGLLDEPDDD